MAEIPFDINRIFHSKITNFDELAQLAYNFQCHENIIFSNFIKLAQAPSAQTFLPVDFFKSHQVICKGFPTEIIFTSTGTSGQKPSAHHVSSVAIYEKSFMNAFRHFYGNPSEYCFLALLPSYMERKGSSLIYMTQKLMEQSGHPLSGFYLNDFDSLSDTLLKLKNERVILLGVTFALLDFASAYKLEMPELIVMETGGMKGRREELTRAEVHSVLKNAFGVQHIHSEYGMTELLSQAYAKRDGRFHCPPWMKVMITDINDPFSKLPEGKTGVINIIDLANFYSCSFIQTADLGRLFPDGSFEVLGRLDNSDMRGCSLMYL
jgi:hypothetical protein